MTKNKQENNILASDRKTLRKCAGCGELFDKTKMLRVLRVHDSNEIIINPDSKFFGRSAYICYNVNCIKLVIKKKRLQKLLRKNIQEEIINKIESVLN